MDEEKQWRRKIDLPFVKVRESDEEKHIEVGPISVHREKGQEHVSFFGDDMEKSRLNARLIGFAWALFLILVGLVLTYESIAKVELDGAIQVGTGLILLGLNVARLLFGLGLSAFWSVVGLALLIDGAGEIAGYEMPTVPLLLIIIGFWVIAKSMK